LSICGRLYIFEDNFYFIMNVDAIINTIESRQLKTNLPQLNIGDTVKLGLLISEGDRQRTQPYEGVIIKRHRAGIASSITVRRVFQGVGVEKTLLLHSPQTTDCTVIRRAKVRRAKLYYLRNLSGKATRLKQRFS